MIKLPIVGAAYKFREKTIDCQNCINWYAQVIESPNGDRVSALIQTAGLRKVFQGDNAGVRCLHVLSNGALLAVIGKKLYHSKSTKLELVQVGTIDGLNPVIVADNGLVAMLVNGTTTYVLDLTTLTVSKLTGSNVPRSSFVAFLDGRFVMNKVGTGRFVWTALYSTEIDPLSYATAESSPDPITAIIPFQRELWMFGSQSIERYYSSGNANSPFTRLPGGVIEAGCVAPYSISRFGVGLIWLSVTEFGAGQVVISDGSSPIRISTHAIEGEIRRYGSINDTVSYAYQQDGHAFYMLSFGAGNATWCYDASTKLWHQRSYFNAQGYHDRHRSQCHAYFRDQHLVGDYRNGKLYVLDVNQYTDDGEMIMRERTIPAVLTDGKPTRFNRLEIVCETGFADPALSIPIGCAGATDTFFVSLFDQIRVSTEQWSFESNSVDEQDLRDKFNSHGFAIQDSGDFMNCGDVYRLININATYQSLKIESLTGNNYIEVLQQTNTAWSFIDNPSVAQELNVCFAPNATTVPTIGMQATPDMALFIPGSDIDLLPDHPETVALQFNVNGQPVQNVVATGFDFYAAYDLSDASQIEEFQNELSASLLAFGVIIPAPTGDANHLTYFNTQADEYKIVSITSDLKLPDYFFGGQTIGIFGQDTNFTFNILHNTEEMGFKAEFCLINPQLPPQA